MAQGIRDHEEIWGRHKNKSDDFANFQTFRKGWEEVLETGRAGDAHVGKGKGICLDVSHGQLEALQLTHATLFVHVSFASLDGKTSLSYFAHLWGEKFPGLWEVREEEAND